MKDERVYLVHAIDGYTVGGREAFFSDPKTQDAVIRNIEIIGQAVKRMDSGVVRTLRSAVR